MNPLHALQLATARLNVVPKHSRCSRKPGAPGEVGAQLVFRTAAEENEWCLRGLYVGKRARAEIDATGRKLLGDAVRDAVGAPIHGGPGFVHGATHARRDRTVRAHARDDGDLVPCER